MFLEQIIPLNVIGKLVQSMLERLKKPISYCRRLKPGDDGYLDGIESFAPPVKRLLNYRSISGEALLLSGGEVKTETLSARMPVGDPDAYREGDRAFIKAQASGDFDPVDPGCDFRVASVREAHGIREILFERLV